MQENNILKKKALKGNNRTTELAVFKMPFFFPCSICFIFYGIFPKSISLSKGKSPTCKHFSDLLSWLKKKKQELIILHVSFADRGYWLGFVVRAEYYCISCCSFAVKLDCLQDIFIYIHIQLHLKDPDTLTITEYCYRSPNKKKKQHRFSLQ